MKPNRSQPANREFLAGFNDAFQGQDCKKATRSYVDGYMKGVEVAKSAGRTTFHRSGEAATASSGKTIAA